MPESYNGTLLDVWIAGLKKILPKFKKCGWSYNKGSGKVINGKILEIIVCDSGGKHHWLRVNEKGQVYFAPTTMTCF